MPIGVGSDRPSLEDLIGVLGTVDPGAEATFLSDSQSSEITAAADGQPVAIRVAVATPTCFEAPEPGPIPARPTFAG